MGGTSSPWPIVVRGNLVRDNCCGLAFWRSAAQPPEKAHGITHLLTLNVQDFVRYSGIKVVHPREITRT
jgi:hypothetical protein